MAQVLIADERMVMDYTVDGQRHVQRLYCARGADDGTDLQLICRDGITVIHAEDAATSWVAVMAANMSTDSTIDSVTLEHRSGSVWNPLEVYTPAYSVGGGTYTPAAQATWVIRDTAFKFIRLELMESLLPYAFHSATGYTGLVNADLITDAINGSDADTYGIYQWAKSRGNRYLRGTGCIAGFTGDMNDKLKRNRGLA